MSSWKLVAGGGAIGVEGGLNGGGFPGGVLSSGVGDGRFEITVSFLLATALPVLLDRPTL